MIKFVSHSSQYSTIISRTGTIFERLLSNKVVFGLDLSFKQMTQLLSSYSGSRGLIHSGQLGKLEMHASKVEIDLSVLRANVRNIRRSVGNRSEIMMVVKADAYGHGLVPIARAANREGVRWFAVAYLHEALKLREVLPDVNILILGVVDPTDVRVLSENRIIPILACLSHGRSLALAASELGVDLPVHLKIDTGMGRLGFQARNFEDDFDELLRFSGLDIQGVCSHFAKVEPQDIGSAERQAETFERIVQHMEYRLGHPVFKHLSNSRALLYYQKWDFDAVRPGIVMYGYGAEERCNGRFQTHPILEWKTSLMQLKRVPAGTSIGYYHSYTTSTETVIGVLAVGYADGYNRALSNRGHVLVGGRRCPVVGRVTMNWITADLGPSPAATRGSEAVLIGRQGNETLWASELARICRTIPYEILTSIKPSIQRVYLD